MSFRLVPKSVTLNDVMAVTSRHFAEFGKIAFQHKCHNRVYLWRNLCTSLLYFVVRVHVVVKKVHVRYLIS